MNQSTDIEANLTEVKIGISNMLLEVSRLEDSCWNPFSDGGLTEIITAINSHANAAFNSIRNAEESLKTVAPQNIKDEFLEDFEIIKVTDEKPDKKISISKKFNGEPGEFAAFWKEFAPIHKSPNLTDSEKLKKLLDALAPNVYIEFLSTLNFDIKAENSKKVTNLFIKKYNRPDAAQQSLINRIKKSPQLHSDERTFRYLYSYVLKLKALDYDIEDPELFKMIVERIPKKLCRHLKKTGTKKSSEEYMTKGQKFYIDETWLKYDEFYHGCQKNILINILMGFLLVYLLISIFSGIWKSLVF